MRGDLTRFLCQEGTQLKPRVFPRPDVVLIFFFLDNVHIKCYNFYGYAGTQPYKMS